MTNDRSALISAADLNARLQAGTPIRLVDATFYLPNENKDARALFEQAHIPGAQFFDIDAVSTPSDLPHTAPTPEIFAAAVGAMGITADDTVVVYDQKNMFSAPRGWWTFRLFGHEDVLVLNGGLPAWRAAGYGIADAPTRPEPAVYEVRADLRSERLADKDDVSAALAAGHSVADARPGGRFTGADNEPRAGMRSGHMPGAVSAPLSSLLDQNGHLLAPEKLADALAVVDTSTPVITTCGSGVTAAGLSLGLHELGVESRVYDGSWSEWGREASGLPVVEGD
ncbi:MAG: 3-mercaptopyruvate sulfurtransferase [Rhodospirillaceae bacterium]|nr:MAG: 3-mercaptopyruvate sulfurtransferase [Rhodospirillaceae bacterium]